MSLIFYVNGAKVIVKNPDPSCRLLKFLRNELHLTGTKLVCGEGGCGACTVMISKYNPTDQKIHHYSVNACLMPVCSVHGLAVTTIEGIGSLKTRLHPVQERIAKSHGSQCGFCTPGMGMSMYALLRNNPHPTMKEIEKNLEGNLCRCTGYRPILDGYRAFSKNECGMGENCCKNKNKSVGNAVEEGSYKQIYDPSQEPIFPPDLKDNYKKYHEEYLVFEKDGVKWYRPVTLSQLLDLKHQFPQAKMVVGNTEIGIETTFKNMKYPVLINASDIPELTEIEYTETGIKFGASVTLSMIEEVLQDAVDNKIEGKTRGFFAIIDILRWFAGKQIRNVAGIGGNIMTASPISDLNPIFQACGVILHVQSRGNKQRNIPMDGNFFTGYRKTQVETSELLVALTIPFSVKNEYIQSYKQSIRKDDDIAIVNSGMRVVFKDQSDIIEDIYLSYGGMAPTTVMAKQTMKRLKGRKWNEDLVNIACEYLEKDLPLSPDAPGGTVEYRQTLTTSFFFKFYLSVAQQLAGMGIISNVISKADISATVNPKHEVSRGTQIFDLIDSENKSAHGLWKPLVHSTAYQQATGEAVYLDDVRPQKGELSTVQIYSGKAHANIIKIHLNEALDVPGVTGYIDYRDVTGSNHLSLSDEKLFAEKKVETEGAVIGCIVAESHDIGIQARRLVKIEYEELPAIISIQDAIDNNSYFKKPTTVQCGDIENEFKNCKNILEGEVYMGAQEQFYFETQSAIAIPKEDGEMDVHSSTQCPTAIQASVAQIIGVPFHKVRCLVKRIGGGFGGKETQCVNSVGMAATAAMKYNCPVRCVLDREDDMVTTGTRHSILAKYKVGFSDEGRLHCLDINTYLNCGDSFDLSEHVMMVILNKGNNCYNIPNFRTTGYLCKTNIRSNTAFRGFGLPQGVFTTETVMQHIIESKGLDPLKIRQLNFFKEGDRAHINQIIKGCHVQDCWNDCLKQSNYIEREQEVKRFNRENRWRKRGIFIMPMQFGIGFGRLSMNQGGASINIYTDGSVLLAHGGVEMGQGINVKMIQVASGTLGIPTDKIHIIETGTNTVPNTSATAASTGTDLNGMAVKDACEKINRRLEKYKEVEGSKWEDWISEAHEDRVSLSATGFYKTPGLGYDKETGSYNTYDYFTFGAGCSEVEIDCLTGDHTILRTDLVIDVGFSLNPAIDIGQVEGAFVQGCGLVMLEQYKVSPSGNLLTRGPGTYKLPSVGNIPKIFNVSFLKDKPNPKAVYSSKAIGEPPLLLAISVFFATKEAMLATRREQGLEGYFRLDSPATPDVIRMACQDQFTKQFPIKKENQSKSWFVKQL